MFIKFHDKDVSAMLGRIESAVSGVGLSRFMAEMMRPYLNARARARFANEGDDVVGKWLPLSEGTAAIRESKGYPGEHPINHRTGQLERWITGGAVGVTTFPGGVLMTYPKDAPTGELAQKIQTAQEGKGQPYTPARPVLGLNETDFLFAANALETHITRAVRGGL
jgi:hypothetical protein